MKVTRVLCSFAVLSALWLAVVQEHVKAQQLPDSGASVISRVPTGRTGPRGLNRPGSSGYITEVIPDKYQERYQSWKTEFLSTDTGRRQWETYAQNPRFALTITVSRENAQGARTGKYKWNDSGGLIAATITLGCRIDDGFPNPIYYPVMNSLSPGQTSSVVSGNVLAATKIAHEFGHVNRMLIADGALIQLQTRLIPSYNKILLSNGRNTRDPRLVELARQMGGTPVEIWEDHEYWGEANAMLYLCDKLTKESLRCTVLSRIKRTVQMYAENYAERFVQIAQAQRSPAACGW
jgi:hypothetical protein